MKTAPISGLRRITAFGLGLAMVGGLSLVAAAPASATPATYLVTGTVAATDGTGALAPLAGAELTIEGGPSSVTAENGAFTLSVEPGTHTLTTSALGYVTQTSVLDMPAVDIDLGQITLVQEAPATPATYSISGVVTAKDANPAFAPTLTLNVVGGYSGTWIQIDKAGNFTIPNLAPGTDLWLTVSAEGYATQVKTQVITDADVTLSFLLLPPLTAGTVSLSGTVSVGSTLTATPAGWPAGTTFSYQWGAVGPHAQHSGDIQGAESSTLPVTADIVNKRIWVQAIGHLDGFADGYSDITFGTTPQLPIAAAPVADSADLAAFLAAAGSTPASQTSTGLPAGALNPAQSYTANVQFAGSDTFVDAYVYSSPISIGTFPVVNGIAQITLSPSVLSQLAAGSHTLVVVGQFTGAVSSVTLNVAAASATSATTASLAATGFNAAVPFGVAALAMLLGAALVLRRRSLHA